MSNSSIWVVHGGPNSAFKVGAGRPALIEILTSVRREDPHDAAPNLGDAVGIKASWLRRCNKFS